MKYYLKKFAIDYLIISFSLTAIFILINILLDSDHSSSSATVIQLVALIYYDTSLIQRYKKRESGSDVPSWRFSFVCYTTLIASLYHIVATLSFLFYLKYNLVQIHLLESSLTDTTDIATLENMKIEMFTEVPFLQIIDNHFTILIVVVILSTLGFIFLTQLFGLRKKKFSKLLSVAS